MRQCRIGANTHFSLRLCVLSPQCKSLAFLFCFGFCFVSVSVAMSHVEPQFVLLTKVDNNGLDYKPTRGREARQGVTFSGGNHSWPYLFRSSLA